MSNIGSGRDEDLWQAAGREARYQRRPVQLRAIAVVALAPAVLLGIQIADVLRYGFWPRPTSEAAFFVAMLSALVALGLAAWRIVRGRRFRG